MLEIQVLQNIITKNNSPLSHEYHRIACNHILEEQFPQGVLFLAKLYQDQLQHPPNHQPTEAM